MRNNFEVVLKYTGNLKLLPDADADIKRPIDKAGAPIVWMKSLRSDVNNALESTP